MTLDLKLEQVRSLLKEQGIDGWLLYDFQQSNLLAHQFLELEKGLHFTRRFFYWIPKEGQPIKICHAIESHLLASLPGKTLLYHSWTLLHELLAKVLKGSFLVAMEYSPKCALPTLSLVDAGTCELVRSFGVEIQSSAPLLSHFTARLTPSQIESHREAAHLLEHIVQQTWDWLALCLSQGASVTEWDVQHRVAEAYTKQGFEADSLPICAVNEHSANPHFSPEKRMAPIQKGDFILLDLWCKKREKGSVYADITRVAIAADQPNKDQQEIFQIVYDAQQKAILFVADRLQNGLTVQGYEVDQVCRSLIDERGYGSFFTHRTGHNIEEALHGSGANLDNFETKDTRPLLSSSCYSVEPGIYLPSRFGIRLESDLLITPEGKVEVTGGVQKAIYPLFGP